VGAVVGRIVDDIVGMSWNPTNEDGGYKTPETHPEEFTRFRGGQGFRDPRGNNWKKDKLHKDHWDISNRQHDKIQEVDFDGRQLWPNGPKNNSR
jgi:hypothetical protein